jgi:hypothetical protein
MAIDFASDKDNVLLNEKQVAVMLGLRLQTLRNWRYLNKHLNYYKIGRLVKYCPKEIERYMKEQQVMVGR